MNKKVIKVMIGLVVVFLLSCYILKIFFPEQFVMVIQSKAITTVGHYVDNNLWLHIILACITSFLTYFLYTCAVTHKWCINWKELIAILVFVGAVQGLYELDSTLASGISLIAFLIIPAISGANIRDVAIVFSVHSIAQILSTLIRNLPFLLTDVNYATIFLMMIEGYFWLLLFYFYFNYKRGNGK